MDAATRFFLWVLVVSLFFAVLLGLFGALTGALRWRQGISAGTYLGLSFAKAFERVRGETFNHTTHGALAGFADGAIFGLVLGTGIGFLVGRQVPAEWQTFRPILLAASALVLCAIALGLFAGGMTFLGTRATLELFLGGVSGALIGFFPAGLDGLLLGALAGAALCPLIGWMLSPRRDRHQDL